MPMLTTVWPKSKCLTRSLGLINPDENLGRHTLSLFLFDPQPQQAARPNHSASPTSFHRPSCPSPLSRSPTGGAHLSGASSTSCRRPLHHGHPRHLSLASFPLPHPFPSPTEPQWLRRHHRLIPSPPETAPTQFHRLRALMGRRPSSTAPPLPSGTYKRRAPSTTQPAPSLRSLYLARSRAPVFHRSQERRRKPPTPISYFAASSASISS
jgi:hypothetical protein